jgi:putative transposase
MVIGASRALVNRVLAAEGKPATNHKRIFRIMKRQDLLLVRYTGRRKGRLHDGKVVVMRSNFALVLGCL